MTKRQLMNSTSLYGLRHPHMSYESFERIMKWTGVQLRILAPEVWDE